MAQANKMGLNRTGMDMSPFDGKAMADSALALALTEPASPLEAEVLINKLGQRLAFERAGVRLYDALIKKCSQIISPAEAKIVSMDDLKHFRDEEHEHAMLVQEVMSELGADPTAMTPDADVGALASLGLPKVVAEARTNLLQSLEALQVAELTDNAAWADLIELCRAMGLKDIATRFDKPLSQEEEHQKVINGWIRQLLLAKSSGVE